MKSFTEISKEKVIIFDGAMGTNLQNLNLSVDDYEGQEYFGFYEYLVATRPTIIEKIHSDFLSVGCDVVETNTFCANSIMLQKYNLQQRAYELNYKAAMIAKRVTNDYFSESQPRFVAGSIGPTNKLPSLEQITFKELSDAYYIQTKGLVEGGVDLLVIETCRDLLQIKAAVCGVFNCLRDAVKELPVIVSVSINEYSKMRLGSDIKAVLVVLQSYPIHAFGINCIDEPVDILNDIMYLSEHSPFSIFCMPNAGIPENVNGSMVYKLSPNEFSWYLTDIVKAFGVNIVGGCCGTTKDHIKELVKLLGNMSLPKRQ